MAGQNISRKIYMTVVEDVISNVREAFLDEGVDEQVLQELKQLWETKLHTSRALEPAEADQSTQGNVQYVVQPQSQQHMVQGTSLQHQIPVPVQIVSDGQISNAANMAFNAQPGMFTQQVQALVNVNPGQQITLQPTANGQYILHTVPGGVSQGQMVTLPQQTIIQQNQQINQVQSSQGIPQMDGACDEQPSSSSGDMSTEQACSSSGGAQGTSNLCDFEIEIDTSNLKNRLSKKVGKKREGVLPQFDGTHDTSSSEEDNFDDDDDDDDEEKEENDDAGGEDEEPLNSEDDVSEIDPQELFDTDNVVVCQFEKVTRNKNKWKFNLKDGIMNLDGKDHVFQRGNGEADW